MGTMEHPFEKQGEEQTMFPTVQVGMLGDFYICCGEKRLLRRENRSKKLWQLMALLLQSPGTAISQGRLIRLLWPDSRECADPANSLKNLVYRARMLMEQLGGINKETGWVKGEYILFGRGAYSWNMELPCGFDIWELERLEAAGNKAQETSGAEYYRQVMEIYRGPYLSSMGDDSWILEKREHYEEIYVRCVMRLCGILQELGQYSAASETALEGLSKAPFSEELHKKLFSIYLESNCHDYAITHYKRVLDIYGGAGQEPPVSLKSLYGGILENLRAVEVDMEIITGRVLDEPARHYPYICDFPVFKHILTVQYQDQYRSGECLLMLLITITQKDGGVLGLEELRYVMPQLQCAILKTLRVNDLVTRYSPSQFLLGLKVKEQGDGPIAAERIVQTFMAEFSDNEVEIKWDVRPLRKPSENG